MKGIDIQAAAIVAKQAPHVRFLVAGAFGSSPMDKAYTDSVRDMAQSLEAERFMTFLGPLDRVRALLQISDIFAAPSRSEGFSNALLEAMESDLPCVATSVGGNPEVVVDGVTGFLVPPEDPELLADRILALVRDERRRRFGEAGRKRILENFTAASMTARLIENYEHLLGSPSSNRGARGGT